MRYIGDVHGDIAKNMAEYICRALDVDESIQVGDFGAGFNHLPSLGPNHKFIRGNHDDPAVCAASPNWIPDGSYDGKRFFVGGAYSTDQHMRLIDKDWWPDEEIGWIRFNEIIDAYAETKPKVMVTHDCPRSVALTFWKHFVGHGSRTTTALQMMFEIHQPDIWIFGHHHTSVRQVINGTEFICLDELEHIDLVDA